MHLARFPRVFLAHLSTPLEPMERLSKELGVEIWIKRDDCTGMSTGGNKTRKLEFLMAEALEQGADMVMTQGATQTNHGRQTAAFAAKLGLKCHILLEDRTGYQDGNYNPSKALSTRLMLMRWEPSDCWRPYGFLVSNKKPDSIKPPHQSFTGWYKKRRKLNRTLGCRRRMRNCDDWRRRHAR